MSCSVLIGGHAQIFATAAQRVGREFCLTSIPLSEADPQAYDVYLPLTLADYEALRAPMGRDFLKKAILPTPEAVKRCDDKRAFAEAMCEAGLERFVPGRPYQRLSIPFVLKKCHGDFGRGTTVVEDECAREEAERRLLSGDYFAQELVIGAIEYASHLLVVDGVVIYHFSTMFRMSNDRSIKGFAQSGEYIGPYDACIYLPIFRDCLRLMDFKNGICCFDYKIIEGFPKIFEINPRFGGSLTMDMLTFLRAYSRVVTASKAQPDHLWR